MSYPDSTDQPEIGSYGQPLRKSKGYVINIVLFVLTFITTVIAGMEWVGKIDLEDFAVGLPYAFAILFVLACHEFGHYFASRHHNVKQLYPTLSRALQSPFS